MTSLYPQDKKQRTLIERYFLSVSAYLLSVTSAWTAKAVGLTTLSFQALTLGTLTIVGYVVGIYYVYRSGLNRRIEDTVFTRLQMVIAAAWVTYFITSTQELRGIYLTIYLFIAMFSLFTLNRSQTGQIAALISGLYGTIIAWDWIHATPGFDLTVNILQWCILSAVLAWLWAIARYMNNVREQVRRSSEMIRTQNHEIQQSNRELQRALAQLNRLATTDELTGLSNRRHFMSTIKGHIDRCENNHLSFGLCLLDVDHFKSINDRWGHQVGDKVLVKIARVLEDNMREYDFLARFGGEEFVLIVTRGNGNITRHCAERLRRAAASTDLSEVAEGLELTVTIGATVFHGGDTLEAALNRADKAMYAGKSEGRNICRFEPDTVFEPTEY